MKNFLSRQQDELFQRPFVYKKKIYIYIEAEGVDVSCSTNIAYHGSTTFKREWNFSPSLFVRHFEIRHMSTRETRDHRFTIVDKLKAFHCHCLLVEWKRLTTNKNAERYTHTLLLVCLTYAFGNYYILSYSKLMTFTFKRTSFLNIKIKCVGY